MVSLRLFIPIVASFLLLPKTLATMSNTLHPRDSAIKALKSKITGDLVLPEDGAAYDEAIKRWSNLAVRHAGAVMYPKSEEDISHAVSFAVAQDIEIAVKGTVSCLAFSLGQASQRIN